MKIIATALGILILISCNNHKKGEKTTDSTTVNATTTETNKADGGPNNGLGDTNSYNRMNDTSVYDSSKKK
jgi:hypothetical protein